MGRDVQDAAGPVVVTRAGVLVPQGLGLDAVAAAVAEGRRALGPSRVLPGCFSAELREDPKAHVRRKGLAALSRAARLTAAAIEDLVSGSPASAGGLDLDRCGLVVGTAHGHLESKTRFHDEACQGGVTLVSPIVFPNTIINSLAGHAAILFGLRGPNSTVTSGCLSGLDALLRARSLLRAGRAEKLVVAACDEVSTPLLEGLRAAGEISSADPAGPSASVPFGAGSGGIYPGEAAAAVLLESAAGAARAGRKPILSLAGIGESSAVRKPLVDAVAGAMQQALAEAGLGQDGVAWLCLSGSGDTELDRAEAAAVSRLFGPAKPAAALKAVFGETFAAAGLLGVLAAGVAQRAGFVPPTPGVRGVESQSLAAERRAASTGAVLVNAVDRAGAVSVVVEVDGEESTVESRPWRVDSR
jgi:3-oxoacyl-[acyl-carrier-protein] synthase II